MTELVKREQPSTSLAAMSTEQLRFIANTDFIPRGMRGNLPAILACVATGRALGIPDMTALRSIHIIDGKATMSAELMVNLARAAGHSISGEYGDGQVTVRGKRADTGDEIAVTWTTAMAQRAGLDKKDNWKKYPEAMLWARGVSQLCRMLFADVLGGVSYTPDEAEMSPDELASEAIGTAALPVDANDVPDDTPEDSAEGPVEPGSVGTGQDEGEAGSAPGHSSSSAEVIDDADVEVQDDGQSTFGAMAETAQARRRARETGE